MEACNSFIDRVSPVIVIVDPKLNPHIGYPRKIPEDMVKRRYEKVLALLADNIAYYAYWAAEKLRRHEKIRALLK